MAKGKSHNSGPNNRNNPPRNSRNSNARTPGANTGSSRSGRGGARQDRQQAPRDPYDAFFREDVRWDFVGNEEFPLGPLTRDASRRARGGKNWAPRKDSKTRKKLVEEFHRKHPDRVPLPRREDQPVPPPAPPVDGPQRRGTARIMYGIEHGAGRVSSWEHRYGGADKSWPKGSFLGPSCRVRASGKGSASLETLATSTDNVHPVAPAASYGAAGFTDNPLLGLRNPLRALGDEYLSNPPSASELFNALDNASRGATWYAVWENTREAFEDILEESLPTLRRLLLCWCNRFVSGVNVVTRAKCTVASLLQCYIAGYELKHAVQHLRENRIPIRAWVNGSLQKGENTQDVRVGLVSLNDVMCILGMASPCVTMPTANSTKGPSAISAHGVQASWEDGATVCPELVARLTRYAEFRPRTTDLLRGLQNRAVVWCKEMGISDSDAARFRAPSVALAWLVSNEEGLALGVLRTSEGHYSVDVYQRGDDGNVLLATGRWSLKGLLTGKNSPLDVVLDTSVPMLRWDLIVLDTIDLTLGNRSEPRYPLAYYFWSPTVRDVLSPTLTIPHK